jgi:hypothetical protein
VAREWEDNEDADDDDEDDEEEETEEADAETAVDDDKDEDEETEEEADVEEEGGRAVEGATRGETLTPAFVVVEVVIDVEDEAAAREVAAWADEEEAVGNGDTPRALEPRARDDDAEAACFCVHNKHTKNREPYGEGRNENHKRKQFSTAIQIPRGVKPCGRKSRLADPLRAHDDSALTTQATHTYGRRRADARCESEH